LRVKDKYGQLTARARALRKTQLAGQAGVTREELYKALSPTGDPRLSTFFGVMKSLGIKIRLCAA
jgi:probable addiction module antidote protein